MTTERTVQELRASLAAFQNNPQAHAAAAATMQQAQAHLEAARALVGRLQTSLQDHGVSWDGATGRITHIHEQPVHGGNGRASSSSSSGASSSTQRNQRPGNSASAATAADAARREVAPDVVRSSRAVGSTPGPDGLVVSSRRR